MQTDQCAMSGPQQYLSVQVSRGIPRRQQAHPVRPRDHGNLASSLIINITGIYQTVQVEALGVFGWAVLVPGLPLGARPREHHHAVLSVPVLAENSIGDQFQPGVVLNDVVYFRVGRDADRTTDEFSIPDGWRLEPYTPSEPLIIELFGETLVIRTDNNDSFQGPLTGLDDVL